MNGLANTLLPEQVFREGGGSLLGLREPREGAGRVGWQPALDAGIWGCGGNEEGSGFSSSWSDSPSDSLDPEPGSSKKLRVLLTGEDSSTISSTGLENRKGAEGDEGLELTATRKREKLAAYVS